MIKLRIPIREQLACLVFLAVSLSLTVITLATWYTNHGFVLDVRSDSLTLTASLKSAQLASNLLLMQTLVKQASMRLIPQIALETYYRDDRSTDGLWDGTAEDYDAIFEGDGNTRIAVQARISHKEGSDHVLFNRTASSIMDVQLPTEGINGQLAIMGDESLGYLPELFPQFNVRAINRSSDQYEAEFQGRVINQTQYLLLGPCKITDSLTLLSITMPIVNANYSSPSRTIGWLTVVLDAQLIRDVVDSKEGLEKSGLSLLIGPYNATNNFPTGYLFDSPSIESPEHVDIQYKMPPTDIVYLQRHGHQDREVESLHFDWSHYPAVRAGYTRATGNKNNAGSVVSTTNEHNHRVSTGYAFINNSMVDWMIVVERSRGEIWSPINRLRKIILICVLGTMAAMLLVILPIAHYFSKPITRLRDATMEIVASRSFEEDNSTNPSFAAMDISEKIYTQKKTWMNPILGWRAAFAVRRAHRRQNNKRRPFRVPSKVKDHRHFVHDELTDLTATFNYMTDALTMQYENLEKSVQQRTAELELMKEAAEAANESKSLFIANMSHELKTPLNGIMGMCAVCMSEDDPVKLKNSLDLLYRSGELLLKLLTDLLTFSKNETGQSISLDEREFTLKDVSSQILAIFSQQAEEARISLSVAFGASNADSNQAGQPSGRDDMEIFEQMSIEELSLFGDDHRIVQVLLNLISNSLKFTAAGGTVTVTARCTGEALVSEVRRNPTQSRRSTLPDLRPEASSTETGGGPSFANVYNSNALKRQLWFDGGHNRASAKATGRWLSFVFEVKDTGPGIPEHLHSKIFEPFVQGDLGLNKKHGGTGLGLTICSQVASAMGGSISLRSEVGRGSVFVLSVPLKQMGGKDRGSASSSAESAATRPPSRSKVVEEMGETRFSGFARTMRQMQADSHEDSRAQRLLSSSVGPGTSKSYEKRDSVILKRSHPTPASFSKQPTPPTVSFETKEATLAKPRKEIRVLVAEDNKVNQEVLIRMLKLEGLNDVTVVENGQEACSRVRERLESGNSYDLVFMDVQMPVLDGIEATRQIRNLGFTAPIVALTAYTEETNVQQCLDSGMNSFLPKPIRRSAIKQVLCNFDSTQD